MGAPLIIHLMGGNEVGVTSASAIPSFPTGRCCSAGQISWNFLLDEKIDRVRWGGGGRRLDRRVDVLAQTAQPESNRSAKCQPGRRRTEQVHHRQRARSGLRQYQHAKCIDKTPLKGISHSVVITLRKRIAATISSSPVTTPQIPITNTSTSAIAAGWNVSTPTATPTIPAEHQRISQGGYSCHTVFSSTRFRQRLSWRFT
jgi:hypothetical protein